MADLKITVTSKTTVWFLLVKWFAKMHFNYGVKLLLNKTIGKIYVGNRCTKIKLKEIISVNEK